MYVEFHNVGENITIEVFSDLTSITSSKVLNYKPFGAALPILYRPRRTIEAVVYVKDNSVFKLGVLQIAPDGVLFLSTGYLNTGFSAPFAVSSSGGLVTDCSISYISILKN